MDKYIPQLKVSFTIFYSVLPLKKNIIAKLTLIYKDYVEIFFLT